MLNLGSIIASSTGACGFEMNLYFNLSAQFINRLLKIKLYTDENQ